MSKNLRCAKCGRTILDDEPILFTKDGRIEHYGECDIHA